MLLVHTLVYSLVVVALVVCGGLLVLNPWFVLQYFESFLVLKSSCWRRESWLLYLCCVLNVMFPRSAMGWSVVCDYGMSWTFKISFFMQCL